MDKKIFDEGSKSYSVNKGKMNCPYPFGTSQYDDFERGWTQALKRDSTPFGDGIAYTRMDPDLDRKDDDEEARKLRASAYARASGG